VKWRSKRSRFVTKASNWRADNSASGERVISAYYVTPGIYQATASPAPDVRLVRTDIAGFFGFAERGPLPDPSELDPGKRAQAAVKLNSWNDFRLIFGGVLPYSYLAYAVHGFFATGGKTCYVVRVGVAATPPAPAIMPFPAAISASQIGCLALDVTPIVPQIKLDSPAQLKVGDSIAIGDPAYSRRLIVTSAIDSQTYTLEDAEDRGIPLALTYSAGDEVFSLTGPAVASPITSIAKATTPGQSQILLGSTDVTGIDPGRLIAMGDPVTGECVSVANVVDDQTIIVQPALQSTYAHDVPVYPILGSMLTANAAANTTTLHVRDTSHFTQNDLVSVEGNGIREFRVVVAPPSGSKIQLGRALGFDYLTGAVVRKYMPALTVSALSPGAWGNGVKLEITPLDHGTAVTHFSLRITAADGADPAQPVPQEFYPLLSLDPQDPYPSQSQDSSPDAESNPIFVSQVSPIYAPLVINGRPVVANAAAQTFSAPPRVTSPASDLIRLFPALPQTIAQGTQLLAGGGLLETADLYLEGGTDGVPSVAAAGHAPPNATTQDFQDALEVLGLLDEISILCCPDAAGPPPMPGVPAPKPGWSMEAIQRAMVDQCVQLQYRVAVLDTPLSLQPAATLSWLNQQGYSEPSARYAAVYYPWLRVPDELMIEGPTRTVPPCGHVAGAYAYTDNQYGVQKPPANVELQFVSDVERAVTNQQQGFLNPAGINVIRPFAGRGIRAWGARSLSRNSNWIYIHTRRLMSMIEDSIEQASQWVVFQTNDDNLRRMLTHSLNVFLGSIWLAGGLQGAVPTQGYYVKCDSTNNTPTTIDAGQIICHVGVAIAAPMEFLVFEIQLSVAGAQVVEV
jgi:hypothetical protein